MKLPSETTPHGMTFHPDGIIVFRFEDGAETWILPERPKVTTITEVWAAARQDGRMTDTTRAV